VEFRKKNGNFKSVDDLDNVPGFGKKTVDKVKKEVAVGGYKDAPAAKPVAAKPAAPAAKVPDAKADKKK